MQFRVTDFFSIQVDPEDYHKVDNGYTWRITGDHKTAITTIINKKHINLARYILNYNGPLQVDHIDRDITNNKRSNLRLVTAAQQSYNRGPSGDQEYKGVRWDKRYKKWKATVRKGEDTYNLGSFKNPVKAAKAYDKKAFELFGEYAYLNFPLNQNIEKDSEG